MLCCDPDERFELKFLQRLPDLMEAKGLYALHFRELWDSTRLYRCDGVWGKKKKHMLHRPWWYDELKGAEVVTDYDLYHLRMIHAVDREKRRDLYNTLDPNHDMQAIGYDYLTDTAGLQLEEIPVEKDYDRSALPMKLKLQSIFGK